MTRLFQRLRGWAARARQWFARSIRRVAARGTVFQRLLSSLLAAAAGVVGVALAGLVLEYVFLYGWDGSQLLCSYLLWFSVSLAVWLLFFEWRMYLSRAVGTLYHIRVMPPTLQNWHLKAQSEAKGKYLRMLSVLRGIDLSPHDCVIDLRADVAAVEDKLLDLFNADDDQTGYTVAPDILWPLAVALGYRVTLPPGTLFYDFGDSSRRELDEPNDFEWSVDERAPKDSRSVDVIESPGTGVAGIHIHAAFTGEPAYSPPAHDVRLRLEVGVVNGDALTKARVGTKRGRGLVHPVTATEAWLQVIRRALHDSREGEPIILTARVPKTISLATGHLLSPAHRPSSTERSTDPGCGNPGCKNDACLRPWRYLLPLNYNQRADAWEPIWLLAEQRDPRELIALLEDTP